MKSLFLSVFYVLFLSFFSCKSNKTPNENEVPFETVFESVSLGGENEGTKVVQNKNDLENFEMANGNEMPKELLDVDFSKKTMLMVMSGTKNTGGFDIHIEKIMEDNDKITVFYKETNPPKDAMLIMALTYPLHAVSIKKTKKEIVFEKMQTANPKK